MKRYLKTGFPDGTFSTLISFKHLYIFWLHCSPKTTLLFDACNQPAAVAVFTQDLPSNQPAMEFIGKYNANNGKPKPMYQNPFTLHTLIIIIIGHRHQPRHHLPLASHRIESEWNNQIPYRWSFHTDEDCSLNRFRHLPVFRGGQARHRHPSTAD